MNTRSPNHFFFGLLFAVIVLAVMMFLPFLTPIVLAAALSVLFGPLYRRITKIFFGGRERSGTAAFMTLIIVAIIVLAPLFLIAGKMYVEAQSIYGYLIDEGGRSQVIGALNEASDFVSSHLFDLYAPQSFDSLNITSVLEKGLQWIFSNLDTVFAGLSRIGIEAFIMLLALFYFLRDGAELRRQVIALSPLGDADDERILKKLQQTIYSIFGGSIAVGIIQGILTGIGFGIFGVPNPALWGAIAAVAALIPGIGTALVLVPAILYLFLTGAHAPAAGLLVWSVLAVGLIDNFLGPIFINRGIKIHPFFILVSVLGGLIFFGAVGFVLGPLVLAFLFALLDIYKTSMVQKT